MDERPDLRIAIVADPAAPRGLLANAVGVVAVGLGALQPAIGAQPLVDRGGRTFHSSATIGLPVLEADAAALTALLDRALHAPGVDAVIAFPQFARSLHDFVVYRAELAARDLADEPLAALGLVGRDAAVRALTRPLRLLR